MKSARAYDMTNRAAAAADTYERIVAAAMELLESEPISTTTLADIAARAEVTTKTVLRRFGERDAVFVVAIERFAREVFDQRGKATAGDLDHVVSNLCEHYERWGALVVKLLNEQSASMAIKATVEGGAKYHRDWCARVFDDVLTSLAVADRPRRLAQLTAICDVHTWDLLRSNLSGAQTKLALTEMLRPLVEVS